VNSLLASSTVPRAFQPVIPTPTVRNTRPWLVPTLATLTVAIVALALWQPWKKPPPASPVAASASEPKPTPAEPSAQATAPLSPAQKLIAQARTLYEPWDLATPDDFKLAEKLLRNAIELEPANSEAWTHLALVSCGMARMNIDRTTARIAEARKQADYAVKLTPNSDYAQFAVAFAMRLDGPASVQAESIRLLRGLAVRQPHDKFILRILGYTILFNNPSAEEERDGLEFLARAAALPGGDPVAEYSRGQYLYFHSTTRLPEAIAAFDRAIALAPLFPRAHIYKIRILLFKYADSEAARQALDQVPAAILRDDQMAVLAALTLFAVNQSDRVINALQPAGPYVTTVLFRGPTAYYKGLAHRRAGRLSAAQTEWNVALQVIQRRLDADPTAATDVLWKARLLALLEQRTEAHATFELYQQLAASSGRTKHDLEIQILLRPPNEALQSLTELLTDKDKFKSLDAAGRVLFDPALDPLRPAPGFAALAAQAKAIFAELNKPAPEQKN
jgi:tetratricopeptide (TPR) repeat protein